MSPFEGTVDLSKAPSVFLPIATRDKHDEVTKSDLAAALFAGTMTKEEYARYLMALWHVYSSLETALEKQANNPVLSPTYNPALLSRTSRLSADISYFLGLQDDDQSWKMTDVHKKLVTSAPLREYLLRLGSLESQPSRLLAHSYVRYMGDLSGGQTIKYKLQKAYALEHEKRGLTFYDFGYNGEIASVGELKKFKDWFRAGMDKGIGEDRARKESLIAEVNNAFELNTSVFAVLVPDRAPEKEVDLTPSTVAASTKSAKSEPAISVAGIVAFVFALGLAYSLLLVEGYGEVAKTWFPKLISHFD